MTPLRRKRSLWLCKRRNFTPGASLSGRRTSAEGVSQIAVLDGNPSEKGPITLRLRFPANYNVPAHWHSMTERLTVLSGAFHVGMGDKLDRHTSQTLEPGGFVSLPASMHHFGWTATPTVVQISLEGPFDIFYVNPADNPEKPLTRR